MKLLFKFNEHKPCISIFMENKAYPEHKGITIEINDAAEFEEFIDQINKIRDFYHHTILIKNEAMSQITKLRIK